MFSVGKDKDGIMLLGTMLLFQCCEKYWQLYFAAFNIIARSLIKAIKNYKYTEVSVVEQLMYNNYSK